MSQLKPYIIKGGVLADGEKIGELKKVVERLIAEADLADKVEADDETGVPTRKTG